VSDRRATRRDVVPGRGKLALALVGALLACSLWSGDARADDVEAARRDFAEGVRLYQRGDYEGARRLFRKADAEHHDASIVYNLAVAEERSRRPQAAIDAYEAYLAEAGESGPYSGAAVVAIAQIKAHSTRLRIETKPSGVRVFVDGAPLTDPTPATLLVSGGHHVVVVQGDGWRAEEELEAKGAGDTLVVSLEPSPASRAAGASPLPSSSPAAPPVSPAPSPVADAEVTAAPNGFVWGAAFALAPYHLLGAGKGTSNESGATQVVAGAIVEVGHAVTDRFEFLARGFVALGPDGRPTYAFMGGPGLSLRVGSSLWLGATFLGGQLETESNGVRYGTDLVFGTMVEVTIPVLATTLGQWTFGVQPGLLLTDKERDNTAFFFPLTFGYRAY
jgi:hypothetical protein